MTRPSITWAEMRESRLLVALMVLRMRNYEPFENVDSRIFDNLPITIKMKKLFENIALTFTFVFLFR